MKHILGDFDDCRQTLFDNERTLSHISATALDQERMITETKVFVTESLNTIFNIVKKKSPEIDLKIQ